MTGPMVLHTNEIVQLSRLIEQSLSHGDLVLMKRANNVRNAGKTPELVLAEAIIAVYKWNTDGSTEEPA